MRCVRTKLIFSFVLLLAFAGTLSGESYQYYPGTALGLGKGFSKLSPTQDFPTCLKMSKEYITDSQVNGPFVFHMDLVDSRTKLYSLFHLDAHLAAHAFAASAHVDTTFDTETTLDSQDLTWVLYAYQSFGSRELAPHLDNDAAPYQRNAKNLVARCGPEYAQTELRASEIAITFVLHNLTKTQKDNLTAHFDGNVSWTGGSVDVSANASKFFSSAFSEGAVHMSAYGFGGGGMTKLGPDLVLSPDNFEDVKQSISKYIRENMTAANAAPIGYVTGYFASLASPPVATNPVSTPPALLSNYLNYRDLDARFTKIEDVLRNRNTQYSFLTDQQIAVYAQARTRLSTELNSLYETLGKCAVDLKACQFAPINTETVVWPENPNERCTKWENGVCYRCEFPVTFASANAPSSFKFSCTRLPPQSTLTIGFDGFIVVTHDFKANSVWDTWVTAYLGGIDEPCAPGEQKFQYDCTDARWSLGLGNPKVRQDDVKYNYYWKYFQLRGTHKLGSDTTAVGTLILEHCGSGPFLATCDSVPPGKGSDQIAGGGFPFAPAQVPAKFFIEVPPRTVDFKAVEDLREQMFKTLPKN